jgi:plasmid stabilization system protein ParE
VIHKVIANREQDWIDIERVLLRQGTKLDQAYVRKWLREFAEGLETPELLSRYEALVARGGGA